MANDDITHTELLRRPKHKASLNAKWQAIEALSFTATAVYTGKWADINRDGTASGLFATPYTLINLTGNYDFGDGLSFFARINNLLNRITRTRSASSTRDLASLPASNSPWTCRLPYRGLCREPRNEPTAHGPFPHAAARLPCDEAMRSGNPPGSPKVNSLMVKINRVYTRTGADGRTVLRDGARLPKFHIRVAVTGSVDEANAFIG
jgi:hypothetical protein